MEKSMLKRLILGLAAFAFATVAHAAGTVPGFNLTPQFDLSGKVMPGCQLFVYQAGTVATPQNAYQDSGLTTLQPNPMSCDASGRLPQWFVADGLIKLRLLTSTGTQVFVGDNLLVVGPSGGGGGGGGTIDPTTVASTGDIKATYNNAPISGWVRMNGRTIGSATSGATERANADTQALFLYLWGVDSTLAVSGGRGASAAADWAANKTIATPDLRGRVIAGLDDMGNSTASRLTANFFGSTATVLGASSSQEKTTLLTQNLPPYTPSGSVSVTSSGDVFRAAALVNLISGGSGSGFTAPPSGGGSFISSVVSTGSLSGNPQGGSSVPISVVQPTLLMTFYIKL